ncbi:MAG: DUF2237 domain-containing protein [Verrucomicrobia bacterium]|nr:MAG: DUF2237 domain-containing protein [Verrucomicrobiota bacterium]
MAEDTNVLGGRLEPCSVEPRTGFYRDGCCNTGPEDLGLHVVCARMTAKFLAFSAESGNDLSTPQPAVGFPGLKPGDRWCLCAGRWREALDAGVAPPVVLSATHEEALAVIALDDLKRHAIDLN